MAELVSMGDGSPPGVTPTAGESKKVKEVQSATTMLGQETFSFTWSIENLSVIGLGAVERIQSPSFTGGPKARHKWYLEVIGRNEIGGVEFLSVYCRLKRLGSGSNHSQKEVKGRFQCTLLDSDGNVYKKYCTSRQVFRLGGSTTGWGWDKFIETKFLKVTSTPILVVNDTLKLHCQVWHDGEIESKVSNPDRPLQIDQEQVTKRRRVELGSNLQELLEDPKFADVAISTAKKSIMVHKNILSARSSVFRAMLNTSMLESANSTIEILDFDEDAVTAMLEFIYTGETKNLQEKAVDLLQLAEKYDLPGLKEDCERALASNLTIDSAAQVLVLADIHNAKFLKSDVIDFINNNSKAVKKTSDFEVLIKFNKALVCDLYLAKK